MFYENTNNELSEKDKNIFQEAKKLFNLRVKIYKKMFFERTNLRPKETIAEIVKFKKQRAEKEKEINNTRDENYFDYKKFATLINFKSKSKNNELVREHLSVQGLGGFLEQFQDLKSNPPKNKVRVDLINSGLKDLKKGIKIMSEQEKETEDPDEMVKLVEMILEFNREQEQGLKILTPNQMLSRLPISLAKLKAENNSEKLKNEIRQLLYFLYISKKITKQLYQSLVDII